MYNITLGDEVVVTSNEVFVSPARGGRECGFIDYFTYEGNDAKAFVSGMWEYGKIFKPRELLPSNIDATIQDILEHRCNLAHLYSLYKAYSKNQDPDTAIEYALDEYYGYPVPDRTAQAPASNDPEFDWLLSQHMANRIRQTASTFEEKTRPLEGYTASAYAEELSDPDEAKGKLQPIIDDINTLPDSTDPETMRYREAALPFIATALAGDFRIVVINASDTSCFCRTHGEYAYGRRSVGFHLDHDIYISVDHKTPGGEVDKQKLRDILLEESSHCAIQKLYDPLGYSAMPYQEEGDMRCLRVRAAIAKDFADAKDKPPIFNENHSYKEREMDSEVPAKVLTMMAENQWTQAYRDAYPDITRFVERVVMDDQKFMRVNGRLRTDEELERDLQNAPRTGTGHVGRSSDNSAQGR